MKSVEEVIAEKSADLLVGWQPPLLSKAADYEFVGTLPPELQDLEHSTWTAGASTKAADLEAAKSFTRFLAAPESLGVFKGKGFAPP
jgi:ABC-type molybdate transport system substrate-binding protein